jgi:hypothetical protein
VFFPGLENRRWNRESIQEVSIMDTGHEAVPQPCRLASDPGQVKFLLQGDALLLVVIAVFAVELWWIANC